MGYFGGGFENDILAANFALSIQLIIQGILAFLATWLLFSRFLF
ncbi:hypothetical protein CASFOL_000052 [Castilleja foliolosa]|uniref:Uncharacterized protein n=1 Tax=Castilleja foliolosa TaxID=1961234 RepID=A0ABD3EN42_9LAMI